MGEEADQRLPASIHTERSRLHVAKRNYNKSIVSSMCKILHRHLVKNIKITNI